MNDTESSPLAVAGTPCVFTFGSARSATVTETSFLHLFDTRVGFTFTESLRGSTFVNIVASTVFTYMDHLVKLCGRLV